MSSEVIRESWTKPHLMPELVIMNHFSSGHPKLVTEKPRLEMTICGRAKARNQCQV